MLKRILLKLTSFKNILVLWSVFIVTFIVTKNRVDFNNVCMALVGVVIAYLPINTWQKVVDNSSKEHKTYNREDEK